MASSAKVKVGIIGSGFEADIHAASFQMVPDAAEVVAIASPTPGNAQKLADRYGIAPLPMKKQEAVWGAIDGFTFLKGSANPWAAWELAKWMTSFDWPDGGPGGMRVINDEDQVEVMSVNSKALAGAYVNPNFGIPEGSEDWFPGWLFKTARYNPWIPEGPGFVYDTAFDGIWEGDSVEDTLAQIAQSIDSLNAGMLKYG